MTRRRSGLSDAGDGAPILVVAVSARMLAELATAAGYRVVALDRFGDLDLEQICESRSLRDIGGAGGMAALVAAAEGLAAEAVVYGAGLENRPDLVVRLARRRTLLGNDADVLRRVREPAILGPALRSAGLDYPRTLHAADVSFRPTHSRAWLRKPLRGGGGRGVREWRGGALTPHEVVQERVRGLSCSIAAVGNGRSAVVLGITEQLIGERAFGGRRYAWCGNVTPPRLAADERRALARWADSICALIVEKFGLRGLFGVDLVWDGRRAWIVEVNPRPTGSLEVIALVGGPAPFDAHVRACAGHLPPGPPRAAMAGPRAAGKAIVYARADIVVGDTRSWGAQGMRDIPHPGERIAAGQPMCTLIGVAETAEAVLAELHERVERLRAELGDGVARGASA